LICDEFCNTGVDGGEGSSSATEIIFYFGSLYYISKSCRTNYATFGEALYCKNSNLMKSVRFVFIFLGGNTGGCGSF
jgi:hypothetical protein